MTGARLRDIRDAAPVRTLDVPGVRRPSAAPAAAPSRLRLFLDSADRDAWQRLLPLGLFHGVTTNPTILKRAGVDGSIASLEALYADAVGHGLSEIQMQTWGTDRDQMIGSGRIIAGFGGHAVVKVPATPEGVVAAAVLAGEGATVTLTAVYASRQALVAVGLGLAYVAPYFGRLGDAGRDGWATLERMQAIVGLSGGATRVLAASLRSADDVADLAARGLDTFTFSEAVADRLLVDEMSVVASEEFEKDARSIGAPYPPESETSR